MKIQCYEETFDVPDFIIGKYLKDFDCLPGSGNRESVLQLRNAVDEVLDIAEYDPEILEEPAYLCDFIKALAIQQAMRKLGILHDA